MVCNGIFVIDGLGWVGSGILSCRWVEKWGVGLVWVTKTGPTPMSGLQTQYDPKQFVRCNNTCSKRQN